jgi:broad specificity phosphatase PhoE
VSALYLLRHGQAGTRNDYDKLSPLGHRQARLLGDYLAGQKLEFHTLICGAMRRQRETAQHAIDAFAAAGLPLPELVADERWNEFDLGHVYEEIAPRLAESDPEFARAYSEMMASYSDSNAPFHRNSTVLDAKVVRAWVSQRFPYSGESWAEFHARVVAALDGLRRFADLGHVAVFTSATPTAISVAYSMGVTDVRAVRIAGLSYNSSISTLRIQPADFTLFSFNAVPHLVDPELRSFR